MGRLTRVLQHLGLVREPMEYDGRLPYVQRRGGKVEPFTDPHVVVTYDLPTGTVQHRFRGRPLPAHVALTFAETLAEHGRHIVMLAEPGDLA
jgi:hypothetical protein